jgi:hypothetical protein
MEYPNVQALPCDDRIFHNLSSEHTTNNNTYSSQSPKTNNPAEEGSLEKDGDKVSASSATSQNSWEFGNSASI